MIGVNGVGKTTSVGKLAGMLKAQGRKVLIAAADTFRAAAGEQLAGWASRRGVDMIAGRRVRSGERSVRRGERGKGEACGRADLRYGGKGFIIRKI